MKTRGPAEAGWFPLRSSPPARPCEGSVPAPAADRAPLIATGLTVIAPAIYQPWFLTLKRFELSEELMRGFVTVYKLSFIFLKFLLQTKNETPRCKSVKTEGGGGYWTIPRPYVRAWGYHPCGRDLVFSF